MLLSSAAFGSSPSPSQPNLLFILVDQQRQDGVSIYGRSKVKTPNLEQLALEGQYFTRAYTAQPVCSPNRASILSGLYPFNHGVRENTWELDSNVRLLPDFLKAEGYATGYFGKWHLGDSARDAWDVMPSYEHDGRGDDHYYEREGRKVYQTEVLADDVIEFIRGNLEKPFLAFVSIYPPHPPYNVPKKYQDMYLAAYPDDERRQKYYGMCTAVDDAVGRILSALEKQDLTKNTLVVYTTEHGHQFEHRWNDHDKRLCYDDAARVPFILRFPNKLSRGPMNDVIFNQVDTTPTLLGLLGISPSVEMDGEDRSGELTGAATNESRYSVIVNVPFIDKSTRPRRPKYEKGEERCIVQGHWKLILSTHREPELYNLQTDPSERQSRWQDISNAATVDRLLGFLAEWGEATGDELTPKLLQSLDHHASE